jgi:hypothetical protein
MGGPLVLLQKLVVLAVVGFVALLLIGPVLVLVATLFSIGITLFSMALPFLVIGLIVWIPIRLFSSGGSTAWRDIHNAGKAMGRVTLMPLRGGAWVGHGAEFVRKGARGSLSGANCVLDGVRRGGTWAWQRRSRLVEAADFLGGLFVEGTCGAMVGLLFGGIASWQLQAGETPVWLGAAVGALLGLVVAVTRRHAERSPAATLSWAPFEPAARQPE